MKEDKKLLESKFEIAKDSIKILSEVVKLQTTIISNKDKEIDLFKDNQSKNQSIISEKDSQISEYKKIIRKQKFQKLLGFGTGLIGITVAALVLL
jgi:beta-lactamase class D